MSTYTSTEEFTFKGGNRYDWKFIAANSAGGSTNIASTQSSGNYSLQDNWSMSLSDIEPGI